MRIGILEDDPELADHLVRVLSAAKHTCFVFSMGQKLLAYLRQETVDLLLIDWNLPDVSGLSVVQSLRQAVIGHPPVVMLTSRAGADDIVTALRAGADDYLVKPVEPAVLVAKIEALQRRSYPDAPVGSIERFGPYAFDAATETVSVHGAEVLLRPKEYALVLMLFRNLNRSLSRSYLFEAIWSGNPELQTRTLDTHISKIRRKLNLRPDNGFRLVTVYAYGYRLEAVSRG